MQLCACSDNFYRTQVYLGSDLWVRVSVTDSHTLLKLIQVIQVIQVILSPTLHTDHTLASATEKGIALICGVAHIEKKSSPARTVCGSSGPEL